MKGGFVHGVLVRGIVDLLRQHGARVWVECLVRLPKGWGFVDVFTERDGCRIAFEAELTARRVAKDLAKAEAIGAELLVIVTPDERTAAKARRGVRTTELEVWVLPLGKALQRLGEMFSVDDRTE